MQLVNLQGTSIFGVGSEWFWSMAQFVVVVVTLFGIYRQLRAQGADNALAQIATLHSRYDSREMLLARLSIAIALRQGLPLSKMVLRVDTIVGFFETLNDLRRAGFVSITEIDNKFGGGIQIWWRLLKPTYEESRVIEADPMLGAGFERLNDLCASRDRDRGAPRTWITDGPVNVLLDEIITRLTDGLELMNEAESRTIPRLPQQPDTGPQPAA